MKHIITCLILGTVLTFFISCAPKVEDPEKLMQAAKELDQRFIEAYNNRDVDAVMETFWNSPELVSFPPGKMETRGWEAAKESFQEDFTNMPEFVLELTEMNYLVSGDEVVGYGTWRFTLSLPDGESMTMDGRYTDVKAKRDGKWVYILDHASAPMPPPPGETEM